MRKIFFVVILCSALPFLTKAQIEELKEGPKGSSTSVKGQSLPVTQQPPLVIVDGFETDFASSVINPNSIQEINVLKDSSATALYSTRGKNGVVLIKMKPGTEFNTIKDFVNPEKNINPGVVKVQLNAIVLPDMKKLLIEKTAVTNTTLSSDPGVDKNNKTGSVNMLVITAKLPDDKK